MAIRHLAVATATGFLVACLWVIFGAGHIDPSSWYPRDTFTYLAAGERLNAGHLLYALGPGDRDVLIDPRISAAPLLSPPFLGVLWRPFALFGEAAAFAWWAIGIALLAGTLIVFVRRIPLSTSIFVACLALSIATEVSVGNINSVIVPGLVLVWFLWREGHDSLSMGVAVTMTALKVVPIFSVLWLLCVSRGLTKSMWVLVLSTLAISLVSVIGAGLGAHEEYVRILTSTATAGALPLSLAGIMRSYGIPFSGLASPIGGLVMAGLVIAFRKRPKASFILALIGTVIASTAINLNSFVLLLPTLAPIAWPRLEAHLPAPPPVERGAIRGVVA